MSFKVLIIGVSEYKDDKINPLPFVEKDISLFKKTIVNHLNIEESDISTIGENPNDCTWNNILNKVKAYATGTEENDTVLVYYSGHGTSFESNGYLICYDTQTDFIERTAIKISELSTRLNVIPAKNKIIFVDSCHSGVNIGKNGGSKFVIEKISDLESEGWSILSSCKANEFSYALEDNSASIFTHFLCEALSGKALKENKNSLSLEDINKYIQNKVTNYAITTHGASQTPTLKAERIGNLEFDITFKNVDRKKKETTLYLVPKYHKELKFIYSYSAPSSNNTLATIRIGTSFDPPSTEERQKMTFRLRNDLLKDLNTSFLKFLKPSEIIKNSYNDFSYPFGELDINSSNYEFSLELTVNNNGTKRTNEILNTLSSQKVISWKELQLPIQKHIEFDCVLDICKKNNYEVHEYDALNNSITINLTPKSDDSLKLKIKTSEKHSSFSFFEAPSLRVDFLETIPIQQIINNFSNC